MPDAAAKPYLADLKFLGKVNHGARNLFRDEQLDIAGCGEKVRKLIDEHIRATGVNPKIPPVDLLATDFKKKLNEHKSPRAKASEVEHAIKHHIDVNLEEDPEYYKSLSAKLEALIEKHQEHWDELVQLLLNFREDVETSHHKQAEDLGLSDVEYAFHNILAAEITRITGDESMDEATHEEVIAVTKNLVAMLDAATAIVDFFKKPDEVKNVRKQIKRTLLDADSEVLHDSGLRNAAMDRFMELAQVKFK